MHSQVSLRMRNVCLIAIHCWLRTRGRLSRNKLFWHVSVDLVARILQLNVTLMAVRVGCNMLVLWAGFRRSGSAFLFLRVDNSSSLFFLFKHHVNQ